MNIHYLDNASTTAPSPNAEKAFADALHIYGNPSSSHCLGIEASKVLENSRCTIKNVLGIRGTDNSALIFTSSGTEANCLSVLGFHEAKCRRSRDGAYPTIIIGDGEHPSVSAPVNRLKSIGYNVFTIPTTGGRLDLTALDYALNNAPGGVAFAAFMLVNNETGALYDIKSAAAAVHGKYPSAIVHCDAVQGFMKTKFSPSSLGVNTLTVSAHKIHSPRGAAALYISADTFKRKDIAAILPGGGQEKNLRSGTENLCAIAAFAAAAKEEKVNFERNLTRVSDLRKCLESSLYLIYDLGVRIKKPEMYVPHIINITLPKIKSETMLNYMSGKGICVSAGSACSTHSRKVSPALTAFGVGQDEADSSLRISLSHTNTEEDIDAFCSALTEGIKTLVRFR